MTKESPLGPVFDFLIQPHRSTRSRAPPPIRVIVKPSQPFPKPRCWAPATWQASIPADNPVPVPLVSSSFQDSSTNLNHITYLLPLPPPSVPSPALLHTTPLAAVSPLHSFLPRQHRAFLSLTTHIAPYPPLISQPESPVDRPCLPACQL